MKRMNYFLNEIFKDLIIINVERYWLNFEFVVYVLYDKNSVFLFNYFWYDNDFFKLYKVLKWKE